MEYPKTEIDFSKAFATDEQCLLYLKQLRYEDGFKCSECKRNEYWENNRGILVCKYCKHETSVTSGTLFHRSRIPLTVLFRAIWHMVAPKNGVSAVTIQNLLGVDRYATAWAWLQRFRRLMVLPGREKLSGLVEVDETLVGGVKTGKRGRGAEGKTLVIVAVELKGKKMGRVRLSIIERADRVCINDFIKKNIEIGSDIVTDGWSGYCDLKKMKYLHTIIKNTKDSDQEDTTPNVHRVAALLKRWLLGTHQNFTTPQNLGFYLDEFAFRYNRRNSNSRGLLFYTLLKQAILHDPIKDEVLINPMNTR